MIMTDEIRKQSEMIAIFMGGEFREKLGYSFTESGWFNTPANDNTHIAQSHQFRYHNDWNWLMPVVEKIDSLSTTTWIVFKINTFGVSMKNIGNNNNFLCSFNDGSKIENVFNAVIWFINYYNNGMKS